MSNYNKKKFIGQQNRFIYIVNLLLITLFLFSLHSLVLAQEATLGDPASKTHTKESSVSHVEDLLIKESEELYHNRDVVVKKYKKIEALLKESNEFDRTNLERRSINAKLEYLELTNRLVSNFIKQKQEGLDISCRAKTTPCSRHASAKWG